MNCKITKCDYLKIGVENSGEEKVKWSINNKNE